MGTQEEQKAHAEQLMVAKDKEYYLGRRTFYTRAKPNRKNNRRRNRIARASRQRNRRKL